MGFNPSQYPTRGAQTGTPRSSLFRKPSIESIGPPLSCCALGRITRVVASHTGARPSEKRKTSGHRHLNINVLCVSGGLGKVPGGGNGMRLLLALL